MADFLVKVSQWQWLMTAAAFLLLVGIEGLAPRRAFGARRWTVWITNLALYGFGAALVAALGPTILEASRGLQGAVGFPPLVGMGLPAWLLVLVSFLLIDLLAYLQHAVFHAVPALWRVHQVHHSDRGLDASTGVRHHPIEGMIGAFVQMALFSTLGLPLLVILGYAVVMTLWQFFTHANLSLPAPLDRCLRVVLVTPGMHVVHHSVRMDEGNSNFGMVLSVWDRLFGTYRRRPSQEWGSLDLGLKTSPKSSNLIGLMFFPFRKL